VPEPHGSVPAGRKGPLTVGGEDGRQDASVVPLKAFHLLTALGVPHAHGLVFAAGKDPFAVRGEGHAPYFVRVTFQAAHFLTGLPFPNPNGVLRPLVVSGAGEGQATVRGKGDGLDRRMPLEAPDLANLLGGRRVGKPREADGAVLAARQREAAVGG